MPRALPPCVQRARIRKRAAPGAIGFGDHFARSTMMPPVGKSGPGTKLHQLVGPGLGIGDQIERGVAEFGDIMRRDRGRHAHRDALRAIGEQIREGRRQHHRLFRVAGIIVAEIDRVFVDAFEQQRARHRSCALRCSDRRRRHRRRYCRNCPARRPAGSARKNPAPAAPARHRSPGRHADGTSPSRRRRSSRIS